MGLYDRDYYRDRGGGGGGRGFDLGGFGGRSMTINLILINVAVYAVDIVWMLFTDHAWFNEFLALKIWRAGPDPIPSPEFWQWQFPFNVWQVLTAGFAHSPTSIWHLLGNMLVLFFFGQSIEEVYGRKEFLRLYLTLVVLGNAMAYALHMIPGLYPNPYVVVLGASGAVVGIVILFALHFPNRMIYIYFLFPVPAWLVGIFYVTMDLLGFLGGKGAIAYEVHLTGAAFAYLYYYYGWNIGSMLPDWQWPGRFWQSLTRPKLKVHSPPPREQREEKKKEEKDSLELEVDRILSKISREGESSLTDAERNTLEEASRRARSKRD